MSMSGNHKLPFEYDLAAGPEGLMALLNTYLVHADADDAFAKMPHYILYRLGSQESVIKVDTSEKPYHFWYCDLQGRPMTMAIKAVIADFLWEKCGEKERCSGYE